jgi:ketosteroid isomerase-like protein
VEPDNVAIVRRAYEAWQRMDMDGISEAWAPEIEWDNTHRDKSDDTVARGPAEVMAMLAEWMRSWRAYVIEMHSYEARGDHVLVVFDSRALDRSDAQLDRRVTHLWTLRHGRVLRIAAYSDPDEGRRAAGLL